jgi:hypothetical protein
MDVERCGGGIVVLQIASSVVFKTCREAYQGVLVAAGVSAKVSALMNAYWQRYLREQDFEAGE